MKREILKKIVSILISISLLSPTLMASTKTTIEEDRKEFMEYLAQQQNIYKAEFDKEMILERLDYDVEKIIDFVTNKIVYQAYDGILRGVEGTLIGRAGNAHDQAITLASMLNDADVEAQIMVGKLSKEQIDELNQQIASPVFEPIKLPTREEQPKILKQMMVEVDKVKDDAEKKLEKIYKENEEIAQNIYEHIPKEVLKEGEKEFEKNLYTSTVSYRWVRYRQSTEDKWQEAHPAYSKAKGWNLASTSIESGSVNSDDLQKLSMQMWIENSDGKKHSITGKWTAPSANLMGKPLSIEIVSDAMMKLDLSKDIGSQLKESHFFFVKINDKLTKEGKVFDLHGEIYDGSSAEGLNSVFATTGKKISEVTSMFGDSLSFDKDTKKKSKQKQIKKIWLEFEIEKPNTLNRKITRVIFEGEALKSKKNTAMVLLQKWDINIATTKLMQTYYLNEKSETVVAIIDALKNLAVDSKSNEKFTKEEALRMSKNLFPNENEIHLRLIRNLNDSYNEDSQVMHYINEIQILAIRQGVRNFDKESGIYRITDIISNNRVSFINQKNSIKYSFIENLKYGIFETYTEMAKKYLSQNITEIDSAYMRLKNIKRFTVQGNDLVPESHNREVAWWNIDMNTGSTKGMITFSQGIAGGSMAEELPLIAGIGLTVFGTGSCLLSGGDTTCCVGINTGLLVIGVALGLGLALSGAVKITHIFYIGAGFDAGGTLFFPVNDFCSGKMSLS